MFFLLFCFLHTEKSRDTDSHFRLLNHISLVFPIHRLSASEGPVISYFLPVLWWMRCQAQDVFWSLHPGLVKLRLQSDSCRKWLCQSSALSSFNKWFLIVSIESFHGHTNRKGRERLSGMEENVRVLIASRPESVWGEQEARYMQPSPVESRENRGCFGVLIPVNTVIMKVSREIDNTIHPLCTLRTVLVKWLIPPTVIPQRLLFNHTEPRKTIGL